MNMLILGAWQIAKFLGISLLVALEIYFLIETIKGILEELTKK